MNVNHLPKHEGSLSKQSLGGISLDGVNTLGVLGNVVQINAELYLFALIIYLT